MTAAAPSSPTGARRLLHNMALTLLLWTGGVAVSWWWSHHTHEQNLLELAKIEAATNINKDWSFRLWATSHGGVYVPPSEKTPPNPYLKFPERDVITNTGQRLTLMNPAYMLRQIMKDYADLYGIKSHITSLEPINPDNKPDEWEQASLNAFRQGAKEATAVTEVGGKPYLRLMRPIRMEQGCLKCHADTKIKVGEVRGGISTAIPMEPLYEASAQEFRHTALNHGLAWLLGASVIGFIGWRAKREDDEIDRYQETIGQLNRDLEQRVAIRTAQLEAANQELEGFAYSVSHDLRVPLRAIDGFSQIVLKKYEPQLDDEGKRLLNVVRDNAQRMGHLIDDILAFSRAGRLEPEMAETDMEALVRDVWQELEPTLAGREVRFDIKPLHKAQGDSKMLRQVWANLLGNAVKFTSAKETARIEAGSLAQDGELVFYVKDNGAGFDMQYADKLFGVFQRLHGADEFEGTGIGLAIVKRIVTCHGGRVWGEGKVGEGATIYFSLPQPAHRVTT